MREFLLCLFVVALLLVSGCASSDVETKGFYTINVEKIDGCEYVVVWSRSNGSVAITHKADCSNPIHRGRQ